MILSTFFALLPTWVLFLIIVGGSVLLVIAAMLARSRMKIPEDHRHNEVTGITFATVSVIYAVLLAFLVVIVWQKLGSVDLAVSTEAGAVMALSRDAAALPEPLSSEINTLIHNYTTLVISNDWPTILRLGHQDTPSTLAASAQLSKLWRLCGQKLPSTVIGTDIMNNLNVIGQQRALRFTLQREGISDSLWLVLMAGAVVVIYMGVILNVSNPRHHILLMVMLACTISLCLWLIADIDNPFAGTVQVGTDSFDHALRVIDALRK